MKGIVFKYNMKRFAVSYVLGKITPKLYFTRLGHMQLKTVPDAKLLGDNWVVFRTKYCGLCGSDFKQAFLEGSKDNAMTGMISFPQILGHEVVGVVEQVGSKVTRVKVGDWVTLYANLCCIPRNEDHCCACEDGDYLLCRNLTEEGFIHRGIHTGNCSDATGGFGELVPAHETMVFKIPEGVTWQQAVLADPFGVAFHGILKAEPFEGAKCVVYGCGTLGMNTIHILKQLYPTVEVIAIAKYPHQAEMAKKFKADKILLSLKQSEIIEEIGTHLNCRIYYPSKKNKKNPWLIEGVDFIYDTVGSLETIGTGIRIIKARPRDPAKQGAIVITGVHDPGRFEWTPWFFKDIKIIGSNAFATETFEGTRKHCYEHYFDLLTSGRLDPTSIITHTFPLEEWKEALVSARFKQHRNSGKVVLVHTKAGGELM
jgi:threonine dehydrogenase-like Zn-dependent dehydrogenase